MTGGGASPGRKKSFLAAEQVNLAVVEELSVGQGDHGGVVEAFGGAFWIAEDEGSAELRGQDGEHGGTGAFEEGFGHGGSVFRVDEVVTACGEFGKYDKVGRTGLSGESADGVEVALAVADAGLELDIADADHGGMVDEGEGWSLSGCGAARGYARPPDVRRGKGRCRRRRG